MAITQCKRNIPTVAEAVERFVNKNLANRGVRELQTAIAKMVV